MKTILFVENDPVVVTMYRNRLQSEGFRIETAEDGLEALKALSNLTPDLVTLDLMLPKLSGADVLRFIRADPRLKHIPIILFSNAYMTELGEDAVLSSANKRLLKAYSTPALLLESIRELLAVAPGENAGATAPATAAAHAGAPAVNGSGSVTSENPQATASESASPLERQKFLKEVRAESAILHDHCRSYVKAPASKEGQHHLIKLHEVVHRLNANSARTDCGRISSLMKAFDALLSEVMAKPAWASPSVLQTIAQATDCLDLVLKGEEAGVARFTARKVLVVDDDLVCNRVMVTSLKRTNLEPVSVQDPKEGLRLLQNNRFDAILLDVNMPEMTGFELCEQLRRLSHCKTTPVIFVTAYSNFQNRTQGVLSGGDDFITKPVSPLELALKVTIHMLKAHAQRGGAPQPEIQPPPAEVSSSVLQSLASIQINQLNNGRTSGQEAVNPSALAAGSATSTNPAMLPPVPTEFVTVDPQTPITSQPDAPAPVEAAGPVPPNLFLSTTETATSTGDAPAETESQPAAAEVSNESLQPAAAVTMDPNQSIASTEAPPAPASDLTAAHITAEATQPAAPSILDTFLVEAPQGDASQNLNPTASLENSIVESEPAAGAAYPAFPELNAFAPSTSANAVEPTTEPALPPETLAFLNAQDPTATPPLLPTAESQNSFVESPAIPEPTPPTGSEPAIQNVLAETPQPATEIQLSPTANTETETPAALEPQAAATESFNSVATPDSGAPQQAADEPAADNGSVAQPPPVASSAESAAVSTETTTAPPEPAIASPENAVTPPESSIAPPETVTESSQPAVEVQASPIPAAESGQPAASEPQAPVTESLNSIVESNSSADTTPAPATEAASPTIETQPAQPDSSTHPEVVTATEVAMNTEAAVDTEAATTTEVTATSEASVAPTVAANPLSAAQSESDRVFDQIVQSVTCMIYGDFNATPMNLRMVRLALERYKVNELVRPPAASNAPQSETGNH